MPVYLLAVTVCGLHVFFPVLWFYRPHRVVSRWSEIGINCGGPDFNSGRDSLSTCIPFRRMPNISGDIHPMHCGSFGPCPFSLQKAPISYSVRFKPYVFSGPPFYSHGHFTSVPSRVWYSPEFYVPLRLHLRSFWRKVVGSCSCFWLAPLLPCREDTLYAWQYF